jgi:hypothetical protein
MFIPMMTNPSSKSAIPLSSSGPAPGCQAQGDEPGVEVGDPLEQLRPGTGMFIPRVTNPSSRSSIIWSSTPAPGCSSPW